MPRLSGGVRALVLAAIMLASGALSPCAAAEEDVPNAGGEKPIAIVSPRGGEQWRVASRHRIMWRSARAVASVRVEYSTDAGETWRVVVNAADDSPATNVTSSPGAINQLLWQVPAELSSQCRVRISNARRPAMSDETRSDAIIAPSQEASGYQWSCVTENAAFAGRDGAGALVFRDRMWLLGGWNPSDKVNFPRICNSEVWSSADGATWELVNPQAPWEGRHTAGYVVHDDKMWIVGGDANRHHYQNDVWSSADGVHWELINGEVPWAPRVLHYTLAFDSKIWVMGGQTLPQFASAEEVFHNDVWCSADGVTWTRALEEAPWSRRGMIGGSAVLQGRMWILGGGTYDTPTTPNRNFHNDVWSSDDGVNWERQVEFAPWEPRQYHDVAVFDNRMWVMEGYNAASGNRRDVWYSADGVNWYELPDTPWAPRHAASVFVYDEALWMVAGNNMFPDVWKLTRTK